ncbi:hypothetical protein [Poseidonibacter lekithochrous]|uniref:hypothetical protein n=2 Tax=Poseidonibacter lekithochrous TaxID=1904463 RepID=UPI0008FC3A2E|nr:hypothetical protein [Poseidonibacter lekithochrous]QKJ22613.1 putative membrane protein [Poseidonibacter lekithochrous]
MTEIFNNRELSSILLFTMVILYIFYKADDRQSLFDSIHTLIQSFFKKEILVIILYLLFYIFIEIIILSNFFYWNTSYLKDTILWIITAFILIIKHQDLINKEHFVKTILMDNLKFFVVYQFIVNLYTFNFIFEFIMTTIVTFLILIQIVMQYQEKDKNTESAENFISFILAFFVILVTYLTIDSIHDNYQNIVLIDLVKKFFLPFLLTVFYLPFYYILILIFKYETIFVFIDNFQSNSKLNVYTKLKIITICFMNYNKLKKVNLQIYFLSKSESKEEIKTMIKEIVDDDFHFEK